MSPVYAKEKTLWKRRLLPRKRGRII